MTDKYDKRARESLFFTADSYLDPAQKVVVDRVAAALRAERERCAQLAEEKMAGCIIRQAQCAESGDEKNAEWFRAKAQAAESLAFAIRIDEDPSSDAYEMCPEGQHKFALRQSTGRETCIICYVEMRDLHRG